MQFLYFVEFFWKSLISTNTSNYNYRITSNVSSKHDKGFRDDDLVHMELRGKSSGRQRPRGRQRIVHVDNE